MRNITIVGAQWGDEGKGKITDWLASNASAVVRYNGGNNAGHTIKARGAVYKTALIPSGMVQGKIAIIGNGAVVDPWAFIAEIQRLRDQGITITPENLILSDAICVVLPLHRDLDCWRDTCARIERIGTTGRGIGPAYEDKVGRRAIRLADLSEPEVLEKRIGSLLEHHTPLRQHAGLPPVTVAEVRAQLTEIEPQIAPFLQATPWRVIKAIMARCGRVLFEGAQAAMLDLDHGTYPYVTSSNTTAGQVSIGAGVSPKDAGYVLGVIKAYTTRVGEGPFPTEIRGGVGDRLRKIGAEFGVNTGRPRRCGWFDAVVVRKGVEVGGIEGVALTKLDVLDDFDEVKICVGYELDGKLIDYVPSSLAQAARLKPRYETMAGWKTSTRSARSMAELPDRAVAYIRRIEELCAVPVAVVGTGPDREDLIIRRDIL